MDITVKLFSNKKKIPINSIGIPANFGTPNTNKILEHHKCYLETGVYDPIIVDEDNTLIDGYTTLLIFNSLGMTDVPVYKISIKVK